MRLLEKFKIQTYNIGIINKNIESILEDGVQNGDIIWLKHKYKDRFFADPFLVDSDNDYYYILVEELRFWEEKGVISLLKVNKSTFTLVEKKIIIEEETHLSFPFCEYKGTSIIPESVKSGKTTEYEFDLVNKCVVGKRVILNEGLIDASFYTDKNGEKWIFASKLPNPKNELYAYKFKEGHYTPTNSGMPIDISFENTRSAGKFFELNGVVYRPVQNSVGRYGKQTNILRIIDFTGSGYKYDVVATLNSFDNPPFCETFHTFNCYDSCIIVDGSKDYLRFPMKLFYKKTRFLFKRRNK